MAQSDVGRDAESTRDDERGWHAPLNDPLPATRRRLGRYEIEGELGRGAMGVVYRAKDPVLGRTVALKITQLASSVPEQDRAGFERRFQEEARSAASVAHPGVVIVHDGGRDPETGDLFIAFEHLSGRTLAELATGGPVPWREALRLVSRVAEALHYAHSCGIVHCDIKPANIMLLPSGQPKVMDFGVAMLRTSTLAPAGSIQGTPLYMSPEQVKGLPLDGRTDLFSLGALLYLLLTGRAAFAGPNVSSIVRQILTVEPEAPSRLVSGLPTEIDRILTLALAKDRQNRYPDGARLVADIEALISPPVAPMNLGSGGNSEVPPPLGAAAEGPPFPASHGTASALEAAPTQLRLSPPRPRVRPALWGALASVVLAIALGLALRPTDPAQGTHPGTRARPSSTKSPAESAASTIPAPGVLEGQLVVGFAQPLEVCALRVWVGDVLVLEERVHTARKDFWMPVPLGDQGVRVEVLWKGGQTTQSVAASFIKGEKPRLDVELRGKDLLLSWS